MRVQDYDRLTQRDFQNGAIRDEIRTALKLLLIYSTGFVALQTLLQEVEQCCPCGARPESPNTHPHTIGCPVGRAMLSVQLTVKEVSSVTK